MFWLILFALVNAILSVYFERRRWRFATVLHAVLFVFMATFLLFGLDSPVIETAMRNIVDRSSYVLIHDAVLYSQGTVYIAPLAILEIAILFGFVAAGYFVVADVVEQHRIAKAKGKFAVRRTKRRQVPLRTRETAQVLPLYRLLCVMRC